MKYEDTRDITPSEKVAKTLKRINDEVNVILKYKVGSSPVDLNGKWEDLRIGETNLGVAAAEAYLLASGADIAFENAGGIRSSIQKGDVTFGDILAVSPYGNYLVQKSLTGTEVREVLETSLEYQRLCIEANESGEYDAWPLSSGSVLHCAGITARYSYDKPAGERIVSIMINDEPLQETKSYSVVTNNFTAWDKNYPALANAEETGSFCSCEEALIQFFSLNESEINDRVSQLHMINTDELKHD